VITLSAAGGNNCDFSSIFKTVVGPRGKRLAKRSRHDELLTYGWAKTQSASHRLDVDDFATAIRGLSVEMSSRSGTAHLGSVLSCADILAVVFASKTVLPEQTHEEPVPFVLSKGHAALGLYSSMLLTSSISPSDFLSYAEVGSAFEEHPSHRIPGVPLSTGSLGHGLAFMAGKTQGRRALGKRRGGIVLLSDGECNEGTVWEAALYAAAKEIGGLVAIVDENRLQATGPTSETFGSASIAEIFRSFGWVGIEVDGHNTTTLESAVSEGLSSDIPYFIVAQTLKGKGISFMEDDNNWHYRSPSSQEVGKALEELGIS